MDERGYDLSHVLARLCSKSLIDNELDSIERSAYTISMRRELEIATRSCLRPLPLLGAVLVMLSAGALASSIGNSQTTLVFYVVAFNAAVVARMGLTAVDRLAIVRPSMAWDGAAMLLTVAFALVPVSFAGAILVVRDFKGPHGAAVLGCLHLAAIALLASRIPGSSGARCLAFVILAGPVPALVPLLRPLLDASPSFHAEHFPPWSEAFAPILTLIVLALAVPPHHAAPVGEPST